jgi:hypothetical protein
MVVSHNEEYVPLETHQRKLNSIEKSNNQLKEELAERQRINDEKDEEIKNLKHKLAKIGNWH